MLKEILILFYGGCFVECEVFVLFVESVMCVINYDKFFVKIYFIM